MGALIEDLLDLSRITSGKIRLDVRRVELGKIVETAIESARANAQTKDLDLHASIAPDLGPFRGDATRLAQIVSNLLSNAVKFTPKGGRIDVALRRKRGNEDCFEIEVTDTGQGIDAAFLPHVFELFQQEEGRPARGKGGLGLGLSISRQLAELHGGTITAASEGPGKGARFLVRLPAPAVEPDRARTDAARSSGTMTTTTSLQGVRVLTVDDDDDARAFVKAALELRGATVRTASSVVDALAELDRELPDVLLSDIGMPVRDGYSLIRELRERPPERGGALPAAAVSAFAYAHDREASMRAGFAEHVAKPVDPSDLVALVLRLAKRA
jgi:CheY-like chemotaxis protein